MHFPSHISKNQKEILLKELEFDQTHLVIRLGNQHLCNVILNMLEQHVLCLSCHVALNPLHLCTILNVLDRIHNNKKGVFRSFSPSHPLTSSPL